MEEKQGKKLGFFDVIDLPHPPFKPFWDNIVVNPLIKRKLLRHFMFGPKLETRTRFACAVNGSALLYGPPGTGKTTLARGCANRVAEIIYAFTGKRSKLLVLNFGRIFSPYLGLSVKAISDSFEDVHVIARHNPVILDLEEMEVIGMERGMLGAGDPSEVMRSVGAVITKIDELLLCKNVVVIGTSNVENFIDKAVWDRNDLKIYMGRPDADSARELLKRAFAEFIKLGFRTEPGIVERFTQAFYNGEGCTPFSGRDLCRVPYLTYISTGRKYMTVNDVLYTGESMLSESRKEQNNGKSEEKNLHRTPRKKRVGRKA